jgi:Transmembrane amino acid transporter protein
VFLVLSLAIALSVKDLGVVLAVVGATGSTVVSYILPGAFYYNMFRKVSNSNDRSDNSSSSSNSNSNSAGCRKSSVQNSDLSCPTATASESVSVGRSGSSLGHSEHHTPNTEAERENEEEDDVDGYSSHEHPEETHATAGWKLLLAKIQMITGLVIMPVCLIAIFLK